MKNYILTKIKEIMNCDEDVIKIERPPKDEMGDFSVQCSPLRNDVHNNPVELATFLKDNFDDDKKYFKEIKTIGPYLNFYLDYDVFNKNVIEEISHDEHYGSKNQGHGDALLIEHTSINPNAEPHIGRCRNSLIGDFMSNLYKFTGYEVERHYFINDLGKKIALLIIGCEKYGLENTDFSSILDIYVKISNDAKIDETLEQEAFNYLEKVENGDVEMIEKFKNITDMCVKEQMKIFDKLNIHFDIFTHESDYVYNHYLKDILDKIRKKGKLKEDDLGRYYVDLSDYDIPTKEPVLVLTRSNKTSLYPIKDIAYTMYKMDRNSNNNYIVLGEDQEVYMKQIAAVMDILGYKAPELISYSYVLLDGDKMSTSAGRVVLITDFIKAVKKTLESEFQKRGSTVTEEKLQILTNACIKFTMLNVSRHKIVNFNLESATSFTGESGMYILYSYARINSILKNNKMELTQEIKFIEPLENKIIKELSIFPEIIEDLLRTNEPAHLTKYIFGLTQYFSKFYEQINISNEKNPILKSSRLKLLMSIQRVIKSSLNILGIETVDTL